LIPVPVFKSASQGLAIFRFSSVIPSTLYPRFEVQKGTVEDDLLLLPILPISFQLQALTKNFVNVPLLSIANGGLHQDLIAVVLLSSPQIPQPCFRPEHGESRLSSRRLQMRKFEKSKAVKILNSQGST
jgi:hypothetical protein